MKTFIGEVRFNVKISNVVVFFINSTKKSQKKKKLELSRDRSSRPEVFCKKGVIRNFAKFTGKHLSQSLFFDEVVFSYRTPPVLILQGTI